MKRAFTLIELLIVVAIIAILAAIAVPNFLEAQTRSKVSRMKADLRTVAVALESYMVDVNHYPPTTYSSVNGTWPLEERWKFFPGSMTTPVAYISSNAPMQDIFRVSHHFGTELANEIMYLPSFFYQPPYSPTDTSYGPQTNRYGAWVIRSAGPDTWYQNFFGVAADYDDPPSPGFNLATYEPTNGTISGGDIYRSQKNPDDGHI